ncbi:hypothetical protein FB451DRAFT_1565625 [Mycena latifolia]|nr:hypothetical protein FB451DRAFT_1565625 [Mycena latifolia]
MSLAGSPLSRLYVSYDIACQWHKNIWERMRIFDFEGVQFKDGEKYVVFLVPKFHLPAHIELCNILFSFNLTPYVGRTDGESPERGWASANRLANSTSISGPGTRRDAIDYHFQDWNWKKIVALGGVLLDRMQKYVPSMLETRAAWVDMEASFPEAVIQAWTEMVVAWEADSRLPNPFASTTKHENLQQVRRKLAVIASEDIAQLRVRGDMHDTEMLSMGLQLEEAQRALAVHVKHVGAHETVDQGRRRIERETKLRRKIGSWMEVQRLFIPEVTVLRSREDEARKRIAATQPTPGVKAQDMKLWMPSQINKSAECDKGLYEYEYDLRKGQAFGALDEMCDHLLVRTHEYKYKDRALRGVKAMTRSGTRIKGIDARIDRAAAEYRAGRAALVSLGAVLGRTEWQQHLRPLNDSDIRGRPRPTFGDVERQKGGRKKKAQRLDPEVEEHRAAEAQVEAGPMSWIWMSRGQDGSAGEDDLVKNEALRVEWAKTRARAMRYAEEVELLEEEMRRVLQFLSWRATWWRGLMGLRAAMQTDPALREGHAAYAERQAQIFEKLHTCFKKLWKDIPTFLEGARAVYATMEADESDDEQAPAGEETQDGWLSE